MIFVNHDAIELQRYIDYSTVTANNAICFCAYPIAPRKRGRGYRQIVSATDMAKWRTDGVRVVRGVTLDQAMRGPGGTGRVTAIDFAGAEGPKIWIGAVTYQPNA